MRKYGYYMFKGLEGLTYDPIPEPVPTERMRDKSDDVLDLIYAVDPVTGFPSGSLSMYLSEKTSDEVRNFIENVIMREIPIEQYPDEFREDFMKLDPDFIAMSTRKHTESISDYDARVHKYITDLQESQKFQSKLEKYQKQLKLKFGDYDKSDDA